jgi:O-antigen/teichoic acid export membrane protein
MSHEASDRAVLLRGALLSTLGRFAGLLQGVYLAFARRWIGGPAFGLFAIALNAVEMISRFALGGFSDAVTYFAAGALAREAEDEVHQILAACLWWPTLISTAVTLAICVGSGFAYELWWAELYDPELLDVLRLTSFALPLMALVKIPLEAIKAKLDLRWAVVVLDVVHPISVFFLSFMASWFELGARGLAAAWVLSWLFCVPLAAYAFHRNFGLRRSLMRWPSGEINRSILRFALPQSLNMGVSYSLARIDALMLFFFAVDADAIGIYTLVAELMRSIRAAKTAFVGVASPLFARYQALGDRVGVERTLRTVVRWSCAAAVPLLIVFLGAYPECITLNFGAIWPYSRALAWLLAIPPTLSAFLGFTGNLLLMTGHSRHLLINSIVALTLNIVLNAVMIPQWGLLGAASATTIASAVSFWLFVAHMGKLEQIRLGFAPFLKPVAALMLTMPAVAWFNTESGHRWIFRSGIMIGTGLKIAMLIVLLFAAASIFFVLPGPERAWLHALFVRFRRKFVRPSKRTLSSR